MTPFFSVLLSFPFSLMLLQAVALLLWRTRPRLARRLLVSTVLLLIVLSVPNLTYHFADLIEGTSPEFQLGDPGLANKADAIVVLAGACVANAKEYRADAVSAAELQKLSYTADLYRATHLPVLVSGGLAGSTNSAEADLMGRALEHYFGVKPRWIEARSVNTSQNAEFSHEILQRDGIQRIFLVTHAIHMRRARYAFERAGFMVSSAPMGYETDLGAEGSLEGWLPSVDSLQLVADSLHEGIGLFWYALRGY